MIFFWKGNEGKVLLQNLLVYDQKFLNDNEVNLNKNID